VSERFRTVSEQAEWLRVSSKTCRRLAARLGAVRVGNKLLFPETKSLKFLESQSLSPRRGKGGERPLRPVS
jgi:excisionase family DNA binding protein